MPGRPLLSLVLVVHREQAYIEECTASVLGQDFVGVQLVAVDDASPDHGPALLDELAERDPRVRVRHLERRAGVGAARNLALDLVDAEHVWFVNTTDLVPPDLLAAVADALRSGAPDVLLVPHSRVDRLGRARPGPGQALIARAAERGPVTLDELPQLAGAAPAAWNKVLRTALLEELGLRFGPAGHGELTVTWPTMLAAERIAAVRNGKYLRREPDNAVRDRYVVGSPFDVFAQHDAVLAFLDARADLPDARRELARPALLRYELSLLRRLPEKDRRAFFARVSERARGVDAPIAAGRLGRLRSLLLDRDSYRGYELLQEALDKRRALRRRRAGLSRAAARARRADMQRYYRARLRRPIDPDLAVFAAYWYRGYACNPRAVYEKARELVPSMRGVWVVKPAAAASVPPGVEHVVAGTREYYDVIARAAYFVNNVNFPDHLLKREGTVHVMTHHGTPLKRMGLDERLSPVTRMNFAALLRRCARWDYSVSSNAFSTLIWERVYPLPYESLEVGYPRNDVLVTATDEDVRRIREGLGIGPDQVAVLYAPTHRDWHVGPTPVIDLEAVADALGPDYVFLARAHYFYDQEERGRAQGRVRDVASHPSVEELCLAADVLMTDYSSIMFDYALLERPILVHAPDWELYRAIRGTYFDLIAEAPGLVTRSEAGVIEAFRSGAVSGEAASAARAAFRARFCTLDDGHAAERVVRRVWLGEREAAARPVAPAAA